MNRLSLLAWSVYVLIGLVQNPLAAQPTDQRNKAALEQRDQLFDQAIELARQGKLDEASKLFEQVYSLEEAVFGAVHEELLGTLATLAQVAELQQDAQAVIDVRKRAHRIAEQLYGKTDYRTQDSLRAITNAQQNATRSPEDRDRLEQAKQLNEDAVKRYGEGNYTAAIPLAKQATEIFKAVAGEQHPDYAASLNNLAVFYFSTGDYPQAETLYIQMIQLVKAGLGQQHPSYATSLNNLAALYRAMGDYPRAEPLDIQAMQIRKTVLGDQHPDYATSLNNLALLYVAMGEYPRAEPLYAQALQIWKTVLGDQHPDYATSLNNLALLYKYMGDYSRAEPLSIQAMEIQQAMLGEQHPSLARSLSNLAALYVSMGDSSRAEPLLVQALEIHKAALGDQHPAYAASLNNLAVLYASMGDYPRAEPLFLRAIENSLQHLDQTASVQTESQQIAMSQSLRHRLDNAVFCALELDPQSPAIMQQSVAWKGSVLVRLRGLRLAAADPAIADSFKSLQSKTQRLSALTNAIPAPEKLGNWKAQVAQLTREKEQLDAQLMRDSVAFRFAQQQVSLDEVREAIPNAAAIVNYLEYGDLKAGRLLMATVVRRDTKPVMLRLGSAADAVNAIGRWRETFGADDAARQAGMQIRKQLWEPLVPHLGDASLIFVSTDGMLGQLPFAALPGKAQQSYLIEDHAIVMLPVPMLLPKMMQRPKSQADLRTALLMGDVDYDWAAAITPTPDGEPAASLLLAGNSLRGILDNETYDALPATGTEIDQIAGLFRTSGTAADPEIVQLRGRGATESAFRGLAENTRWMHLATHGFFAAADKKNALIARQQDAVESLPEPSILSNNRPRPVVGFSPGQLSGLVFAGANRRSPPDDAAAPIETLDDGIMTADEIMYLQLENLELAVLSACETGLGETAGGEGVLGLQRALQIAGARTTVTSLWKVDDAATQALMVEFYRNLFERKLSKLESLRQAQLWLLNNPAAIQGRNLTTRGSVRPINITTETKTAADKPTRSLPAYWAAFQLSGDPR